MWHISRTFVRTRASRPLTIAHVINIRAHRNLPSCCCSGRPDGNLRPFVQTLPTPKKTNRCTSEVLTQSSLPTATADHRKHLKGVDRHLEHLRRRGRHGVLQHPAFVRGVVQVLVDGVRRLEQQQGRDCQQRRDCRSYDNNNQMTTQNGDTC